MQCLVRLKIPLTMSQNLYSQVVYPIITLIQRDTHNNVLKSNLKEKKQLKCIPALKCVSNWVCIKWNIIESLHWPYIIESCLGSIITSFFFFQNDGDSWSMYPQGNIKRDAYWCGLTSCPWALIYLLFSQNPHELNTSPIINNGVSLWVMERRSK